MAKPTTSIQKSGGSNGSNPSRSSGPANNAGGKSAQLRATTETGIPKKDGTK